MRPRPSALKPALSSARPSVAPRRPAETSTISVTTRLPLFMVTTGRPFAPVTMPATCSPNRSVRPISRACVQNESTSSRSTISSSCVRWSTSVTFTPRAASMQPYSSPTTPPPTTMRCLGSCGSVSRSSLVSTVWWSIVMPLGRPGTVPTAITV